MAKLNALTISRDMKPGRYGDGGGLNLLVGPSGSKSWVFRWQSGAKERGMGLGAFPAVTLAEARLLAEDCRRLRRADKDPISERVAAREQQKLEAGRAIPFKDCAETFMSEHAPSWKNPKHKQQWRNTLQTYVYPQIGKLPVGAITKQHVLQVLRQEVPAEARRPAGVFWFVRSDTAGRVRGRIELVLDWAKANDLRTGENPAVWRGGLVHALPKRSKIKKVKHHAALPYVRMAEFVVALRKEEGAAALALEFLIFNVPRTMEILEARWAEIDEQAAIWTVPPDRMKGNREHRIPLSGQSLTVLKKAKGLWGAEGYIFPGRKRNKPLSDMALLAVLKRMGFTDEKHPVASRITSHGFRSTFRDWAAECTNFAGEVAEMALAHAIEDDVEAAYRRGELMQKRRKLMEAWAGFCERASGDNVVAHPRAVA